MERFQQTVIKNQGMQGQSLVLCGWAFLQDMVVIQIHPYRSHSYQKRRKAVSNFYNYAHRTIFRKWQQENEEFKEPVLILMIANRQKIRRMSRKYKRGIDEVYYEMVIGHAPPIKRRKVARNRAMDYLSGIASNFRMAQAHLHEIEKGDRAKVVVSRFSIELTNDDMCRLEPGKLINDNIIDYYLQLVSYRSKQNLSLPKAVKIKKHRLIYYDSLLGDGHICLSLIKKYLEQESMQKGHHEKDPVNWLGFNDKTIPQQSNCYDCGIFRLSICGIRIT
uniref:Ubiquitin-like protease family profile domain-containing protein n=1 Tax=Ditylenchus dipsaci TaxID=166011 RepID=A0A915DLM6_9BILA